MSFSTRTRWISFPALPNWTISRRWGMRTTAIGADLGTITPFVVFVLSTQFTLCCYSALLACMTELVAVATSQSNRDKHNHFHLKIAYLYCLRHLRTIKLQEQSVSWYTFTTLLQRLPANISYSLIFQFISDVDLSHIYQLYTPDHPSGGVQCLLDRKLNSPINKMWQFLATSQPGSPQWGTAD